MNHSFLTGQHVCLRAMEPDDVDTIYNMENNPDSWEVSNFTVPYSRHTLQQYIDGAQNDIFADRQLRLMIVELQCGEVVGTVDLFDFVPMHARAELGMAIKSAYRGKGYGREAAELMCRYAFCFLHLKQLTVHIRTDNVRCLHLFQDLGFRQCGLLRQWWRMGGTYHDVALLQMLREE